MEATTTTKACSRCRKLHPDNPELYMKPLDEFYKDATRQDKVMAYCKACVTEKNRSKYATRQPTRANKRYQKHGGLTVTADPPQEGGKACIKCGQVKDESGFHKREASADGLAYYCKDCVQELNQSKYLRRRPNRANHRYQKAPG
jgi:hypothetical protein